jgi:hypothetical protein
MDDDVRRELEVQGAQILALETVLFCLLCELQRSEQLSSAALNSLFDQADDTLTAVTLQLGNQMPPEFVTRAMKILERIRPNLCLAKSGAGVGN